MFEFYKRRDFGGLISDSFAFFKIYGKKRADTDTDDGAGCSGLPRIFFSDVWF